MEGPLENRFTTIAVFTDLYIINTATHTDLVHLDMQISVWTTAKILSTVRTEPSNDICE